MDNILEKSTSETLKALKDKIDAIDYTKDPEYLEFRKYQIAKELNLPVEALTGETVEENAAQGVALAVHIKNQKKNTQKTPPIILEKIMSVMSKTAETKKNESHEKEAQRVQKTIEYKKRLKQSMEKFLRLYY